MAQFVAVATAHFLALLIPGVDFFLIVRTAATSGWRTATGACLGIASANAVFIAAAFSGVQLLTQPLMLSLLQLAGGVFLMYVGASILRSPVRIDATAVAVREPRRWLSNYGIGLASGLLNPKNALFYLSLAAAVSSESAPILVGYGVWMFVVVLVWDVSVAVVFGSRETFTRVAPLLRWLPQISGAFLVVFGLVMVIGVGGNH